MKKAVCLLLAIFVLSFVLAGCAKPSATSAATADSSAPFSAPSSEKAEPVELTVYIEGNWVDESLQYPILKALKKFEQENPHIHIAYESPPFGFNELPAAEREAVITRLNTEIMAGKGPDVFIFESIRFTTFNLFPDIEKAIRNDAFYDVTDELAQNGVRSEDFVNGLLEAGQYEGAQYVVPLSFSTLCALSMQSEVDSKGFDTGAAQRSTAAFFDELKRLDSQSKLTVYLNAADLLTNMALPLLDYDSGKVNLDDPKTIEMLELGQSIYLDEWNTQGILDTHSLAFAENMKQGKPFMMIMSWPIVVDAAWQVAAYGEAPWIMAVPNEMGQVTATLESYGAVNANTKHPNESAGLLAYLLGDECQSAAAYPTGLFAFPVRKGCTEKAIAAIQGDWKNRQWMLTASPEEIKEREIAQGMPLPAETIRQLEQSFEKINTVRFPPIWNLHIELGVDENGDSLIDSTMDKFYRGEISAEQFSEVLQPRLEFYLNE